eukprot:PITA_07091
MEEEYNSLLENQTWDLVPLPSGRKLVRCKWVYRTKSAADGHMEQPHGFIQDSSLVCILKTSLYGLKQAPRAWYAKMDSFLLSQNFERFKSDPNVYMLRTHDSLLILVLYVDDLLITGSLASAIATVKRALHDRFLITDMGPLHFFLGLEISEDATGIKLSQAKYARDLLEIFRMTDCKPAPTPFLSRVRLEDGGDTPLVDNTLYRQLVGSLLYLTHSRTDLSYAGTITFGIHYAAGTALNLLGFIDSVWAGDNIDRKSTSGYSLSLGSGPICWSRKKQAAIALSSAESEYRGVVNITIQVLWLQHFLTELGIQFRQPISIWCENQSTLKFCRDLVQR